MKQSEDIGGYEFRLSVCYSAGKFVLDSTGGGKLLLTVLFREDRNSILNIIFSG